MAIKATDISFVLSGGINNDEPKFSLGGFPSPAELPDTINNLFTDITPTQASNGKTDFRCFYIFNDNPVDTMYECSIYFTLNDVETLTPTNLFFGINLSNEVQKLIFTGNTPASGSFKLTVDSLETGSITYSDDVSVLSDNIQTALNVFFEKDVTVDYVSTVGNIRTFLVSFGGINKNKAHSLIEISDNNISPAQTISSTRTTAGSPINTIAPDIGIETSPPNGISFVTTQQISIGTLRASEGFPVWIKRVVPALVENLDNDGVKVKIRAKTSPGVLP